MKAMQLNAPGGLQHLQLVELPEAAAPQAGEIQVRIHATSLNYHDLLVCSRPGAAADKRIPMADGAGVVTAVGEGVTEFAVGDAVVSTFFRSGCLADRCPRISVPCLAMAWTALRARPLPCLPRPLPARRRDGRMRRPPH